MDYINRFLDYIVNPVIYFLFGLALVYFLFGVAMFIRGAESEDARDTGRQHMLWGIIGLAIMVSVYGILRVVAGTLGVQNPF